MAARHLIILLLSLDLIGRGKRSQVCGQPMASQLTTPSATFQVKIEQTSIDLNTRVSIRALEAFVGPLFGKKKRRRRDDAGGLEEFFLNHSKNNMSFHSLFNLKNSVRQERDRVAKFFHHKRSIPDILNFNGYDFKEHDVTTEDGYILTIFQLFSCVEESGNRTAKPIAIYLHGLAQNAIQWLIGEPGSIYPFNDVEAGREVWLINFRGNEYAMNHRTLSNKSPAFWRFSFHEQAVYDMPAIIEYIFKNKATPGKIQFNVFATGLGTTVFYIFLDFHREKYENDINYMVALPPVAFSSKSLGVSRYLAPFAKHFGAFPTDGPLLKGTIQDFLHLSVPELCTIRVQDRSFCDPAVFFLFGDGAGELNPSVLRRYFENNPAQTSKRNFVHSLQLSQVDFFRQFDYGAKLNLVHYNQTAPPPYNLYNVQTDTLSFYGQTDLSQDPEDVDQTLKSFGPANRFNVQIAQTTTAELLLDKYTPILVQAVLDFVNE